MFKFSIKNYFKASEATVISSSATIKGQLSASNLHIDGFVDLDSDEVSYFDNLSLGSTGILKGNITSGNAELCGKYNGSLIATNIKICSGAEIYGDIKYVNKLIIEEGAIVSGKISKIES